MNIPILFIRLGGVINILAAVLHLFFWNLFDWPVELIKLSVVNSNIMQMLNLFIIVFFLYTAALLIFRASEFMSSAIGRAFLGLLPTMYQARLAMEFYFPEGSLVFAAILLITVILFAIPILIIKFPVMRINKAEHLEHPWRVHRLLPDFRIEDTWLLLIKLDESQNIGEVQAIFTQSLAETSNTELQEDYK